MTQTQLNAIMANPTYHFDLQIQNTIQSDVTVEMFNFDNSSIFVYNAAAQSGTVKYYPVEGVPNPNSVIVVANPSVANGYYLVRPIAGVDAFVNAINPVPPAGYNSKSYVYFDENGNLNYSQGYIAGAQDTGVCTLSSLQTNYRNVFNVAGKEAFFVDTIKVKVTSFYLDQLQNSFTYIQSNIINNASQKPINPSAFESEVNPTTTIITTPIKTLVTPKGGFLYDANAYDGTNTNTISLSIFFKPASSRMLDLI